jgi:hypothetical protein
VTIRSRRYLVANTAANGQKVPTPQISARNIPTPQVITAAGASQWVILSRVYCHLCDEMLAAARVFGIEPAVIDVDQDEQLVARWDELVPVLLYAGDEVCHYHFDEAAVRRVQARVVG